MRQSARATVLPCLLLCATAAAQTAPPPAPAPAPASSAAECEVWARELSFARSVAAHDAAGFAAHVHADAVFGPSRAEPARGREAVARQWAGLIDGKELRLQWYPARVTVAGASDLAWSTGPALYEDLAPATKQRYRLGQFSSVWQRGTDGVWRVLFDDGIAPKPASDADAAAFHAARRATCPQA